MYVQTSYQTSQIQLEKQNRVELDTEVKLSRANSQKLKICRLISISCDNAYRFTNKYKSQTYF